jgi:hypothetical protein
MIARERTVRDGRFSRGQHRPGSAVDPIAALAVAGRKPGHGTDDTADHHGRLASTVTVTNREITKHRL